MTAELGGRLSTLFGRIMDGPRDISEIQNRGEFRQDDRIHRRRRKADKSLRKMQPYSGVLFFGEWMLAQSLLESDMRSDGRAGISAAGEMMQVKKDFEALL